MAKWVIAVLGAAPCQCFSPGGIQTTSPGRSSSIGPPQRCARPQPAVTIRVWPSGCVCHAVRAPGSKVTFAPTTRAGAGAVNKGSTRTVPVNQSDVSSLDPYRRAVAAISGQGIYLLSACLLRGDSAHAVAGDKGSQTAGARARLIRRFDPTMLAERDS